MSHPRLLAVCLLVLAACGAAKNFAADSALKLHGLFTDHLVLQRDRPIAVWGWDNPAQKITVKLGAVSAETTAGADGAWRVEFPAQTANANPQELVVTGSAEKTITDILVGEVWFASGQSNMELSIATSTGGDQVAKEANLPLLRLFNVPNRAADFPESDVVNTRWVTAVGAENVNVIRGFSAVAYFFGAKLVKDLAVPIGIIDATWGGTRVDVWTPNEGFAAVPEMADTVKQIADREATAYSAAMTNYLDAVEKWLIATRAAVAEKKPLPTPLQSHKFGVRLPSATDNMAGYSRALFDGMLAPLTSFAVRGALWYQGEGNLYDGMRYVYKQKALVEGWRAVWKNPDLYFAFVELPPNAYGNPAAEALPIFREAQRAFLAEVPRAGMAVITDTIDTIDDIHPRRKIDVGSRLALLAERDVYGKPDLVAEGPIFKSAALNGAGAVVTFSQTGTGLATRDGAAPTLFELQGADDKWYPATAAITGADTILVKAENVAAPKQVRHAWSNGARPNLMNKEGLPASSFRGAVVSAN
jgi:sialate O-acetylesterase